MLKNKSSEGITFSDGLQKRERCKGRSVRTVALKLAFVLMSAAALTVSKTSGISPFAHGLAMALCLLRHGAYGLICLPIVGLAVGGFETAVEHTCITLLLFVLELAFRSRSKRIPFWAGLSAGAVGRVACLLFAIRDGGTPVYFFIETVLSLLFAYVSYCALKPFLSQNARVRPLATELACGGVFVAAVACGLAGISLGGFRAVYAAALFCIALACSVGGKGAAVMLAACFGVGCALNDYSVTDLALITFVSLALAAFSDAPSPVSVAAAVMSAVIFELYFDVAYFALWKDCIVLAVGGAAYCLLPKGVKEALRGRFLSRDKRAVRSLINGGRMTAAEQMQKAGAVFEEMSRALRRSVRPLGGSVEEIVATLSSVCGECNRCDRAELSALVATTERKGRACVNDVSGLIRADCPKTAQLISVAADEVERFCRIRGKEDERSKRREELALQLDGVCSVLSERARLTAAPIVTDESKEAALVDELSYHGVPAVEVMVTKGEVERITVVVAQSPDDGGELISALAERVLRSRYAVESVVTAGVDANTLVTLREKTAYDVVFASASRSKSAAATGDTHSFIRVSDTRFMMALCDGMGSGASGSRISETAIDLVESFFKAGFDGKFVLRSVNSFLSGMDEEGFAAFDVLLCDLNTLERTVIKMGSPMSFMKQQGGVGKIEGSALPLGALNEVNPSVFFGEAKEDETIVFLSDGVTDALSEERLTAIIAAHNSPSVRHLCDAVVDEAYKAAGGAMDDMTCIAARIMKRV